MPEDVSVIGCDDIDICELYSMALTTVRTHFEIQGVIAVHRLMDILDGKKYHIDGQLIVRGSCMVRE